MGWDTIIKHIEQSENLLHKYFSKFVKKFKPVKLKVELPDGALAKSLSKKNYIDHLKNRYGDWKQIEYKRRKIQLGIIQYFVSRRYKASGINYIDVRHFDDLAPILKVALMGQ